MSLHHALMGLAASSSAASIPTSGLIGAWYADEYSSSSRKVIPNAATATPVSTNLLTAPRRLFNNTTYWGQSNCTITDTNATDWNSTANQASTVSGTGFWYLRPSEYSGFAALAAGTYTCAIWAKRAAAAGSDQQFRMSTYNTASSSNFTATTSWQRFTWTFVWGGGNLNLMVMRSIDDATAGQFEISDVHLFAGSSDLGASELPAGHMYLGNGNTDTKPAVSGGVLDLSSAGYALTQLASPQTLTNYTVLAVSAKASAAGSNLQALFSKVQDYTSFTVATSNGTSIGTQFSGTGVGTDGEAWSANDTEYYNRYEFFAETFDGSNHVYTTGKTDTRSIAQAGGSSTVADLWTGCLLNTSITTKNKIVALALYNRALTKAEKETALAALTTRAATSGITVINDERIYVIEGHSIPFGTLATGGSYAVRQFGLTTNPIKGSLRAVAGAQLADLVSRAAAVDAIIPSSGKGSRKYVLSVQIGRNDGGIATATFLASLQSYLAARRAAGWYVILETNLPSTAVSWTAWRTTVNAAIRSWGTGIYYDALMDWDTVGGIGGDSDPGTPDSGSTSATTNYADGTHPNGTGAALMASNFTSLLNTAFA